MLLTETRNIIEFDFGSIELKNGVLIQSYNENITVDMNKVHLIQQGVKELTKEKNTPFLINGNHGVQPTLEVRKYGSTKKGNKYISALAIFIIKGNIAHRLYGNMILNLDKRPIPTKLFTNKEKAIKWLKQFIDS